MSEETEAILVIAGWLLAAIVLVSAELYLPGLVLGILGVGMLIVASYFAATSFGPLAAIGTFFGGGLLTFIVMFLQFKIVATTGARSKFMLTTISGKKQRTEEEVQTENEKLIGREVEVSTPLYPTGVVIVDGKRYEAYSQSGLLEAGETVRIVGRDNFRLIVRKPDDL